MSSTFQSGDLVTRVGDSRPWRIIGVYLELGFARLEFIGDAWVKSAVAALADLQPYREPAYAPEGFPCTT